jgi:hypothetical protein
MKDREERKGEGNDDRIDKKKGLKTYRRKEGKEIKVQKE